MKKEGMINDDVYQEDCRKELRHVQGAFYYSNDSKYEIEWEEDLRDECIKIV